MYSYSLKSHPGSLLIDHIKFVGDRSKELFIDKDLKFKYCKEELQHAAKVMGYCHDLGKATSYFQKYIGGNKKVNNEKKSHAFISAVICYYNLREVNKELAIICYLCVKRHHGALNNFRGEVNISKAELNLIKAQYEALDSEVHRICKSLEISIPLWQDFVKLTDDIKDEMESYDDQLADNDDFEKYILIKYMFSVLIYADKEHAIFRHGNYIKYNLKPSLIDDYKLYKFGKPNLFNIRDRVYDDVLSNIHSINNRVMSITLPTGLGKTYICMSSALRLKEKLNKDMKIIYCLPFTSVIDQNYLDYKDAIGTVNSLDKVDSSYIIKHHYLSPKEFQTAELYYDGDEGRFLVQNWNSQIIVTTFIQIFNTIFSSRNSDLIKYNTMSNSIILLDEVQSIPYKYWNIINLMIKEIAERLNIYFIFVTATQPLIFEENEISELASHRDDYFKQSKRTKLIITKESMEKDVFFEYAKKVVELNRDKNILMIVNTIKLSQELYQEISKIDGEFDLIYLSTSIIPKERTRRINSIKGKKNQDLNGGFSKKKIVISTQMIEAGVDIDMDIIIRDIAPLDCIFQSAGRANRENRGEYVGEVHLVKILNKGRFFADYVYKDPILLQATLDSLGNEESVLEENYKELGNLYYKNLKRNIGNTESKELIKWVKELEFEKVDEKFKLIEELGKIQLFIETDDEATEIWRKYCSYKEIEDAFERRNSMEKIKGDFYKYVISVFENKYNYGVDDGFGFISKTQLEKNYSNEFGYNPKEEGCLIF